MATATVGAADAMYYCKAAIFKKRRKIFHGRVHTKATIKVYQRGTFSALGSGHKKGGSCSL